MKAAPLFCAAVAFSLLGGCSSPAAKAKQRYQLLKDEHASRAEVCQAGREYLRALTDAGDAEAYREQRLIVDTDCLTADLTGGFQSYGEPDMEADNMDAMGGEGS